MLDQILKALKDKYKDLGFTEKAFGAVAAFLATTVTEDTQIEAAITGVEPLLKGFQGDADKRVTDAILKAKLEAKKEEEKSEKKPQTKSSKSGGDSEPDDKKDEQGDGTPEWAKLLIEQNKTLAEKVMNMEAGKATEGRKQKLESLLAQAPESLKSTVLKDFGRMKFETEEEFETYFSEKKTDYEAFSKELTEKGLGAIVKPGGASSTGGGSTKEATKEEVSTVLNILS